MRSRTRVSSASASSAKVWHPHARCQRDHSPHHQRGIKTCGFGETAAASINETQRHQAQASLLPPRAPAPAARPTPRRSRWRRRTGRRGRGAGRARRRGRGSRLPGSRGCGCRGGRACAAPPAARRPRARGREGVASPRRSGSGSAARRANRCPTRACRSAAWPRTGRGTLPPARAVRPCLRAAVLRQGVRAPWYFIAGRVCTGVRPWKTTRRLRGDKSHSFSTSTVRSATKGWW